MSLVSSLLFPAPRPSYDLHSFPEELLWIPWGLELLWIPWGLDYSSCKTAGDCFPAVLLRCQNARYMVFFLHGNAEDIGLCYAFAAGLRTLLEVHVLLVEYPGYGICPGKSSEETLWQAARCAFCFVSEVLRWPAEDVIVMGRSLGAALAVRLAAEVVCNGLILAAPFLSLAEALAQYVGGGLARLLVGDGFDSRRHIQDVRVPLMVIHGQQDRMISYKQGKELYDACTSGGSKVFICPEDLGHNCDLLSSPEFLVRPMLSFFSLPDYNFDDLLVPAEAFDKRFCPQYPQEALEPARSGRPAAQKGGNPDSCGQCCRTACRSPCSAPEGVSESEGEDEFSALADDEYEEPTGEHLCLDDNQEGRHPGLEGLQLHWSAASSGEFVLAAGTLDSEAGSFSSELSALDLNVGISQFLRQEDRSPRAGAAVAAHGRAPPAC